MQATLTESLKANTRLSLSASSNVSSKRNKITTGDINNNYNNYKMSNILRDTNHNVNELEDEGKARDTMK